MDAGRHIENNCLIKRRARTTSWLSWVVRSFREREKRSARTLDSTPGTLLLPAVRDGRPYSTEHRAAHTTSATLMVLPEKRLGYPFLVYLAPDVTNRLFLRWWPQLSRRPSLRSRGRRRRECIHDPRPRCVRVCAPRIGTLHKEEE